MSGELEPYVYNAQVVRVIDGDTVVLEVDLGFGMWLRPTKQITMSFRLAGCNCIELKNPGGKEARAYVQQLLPAGKKVRIRSIAVDKYGGRYDARIEVPGVGDLTEHLVANGWAAPWNGAGRPPTPPWPRSVAVELRPRQRSDFALAKGAPPPTDRRTP